MTTVAYKNGILAFDSRITGGDSFTGHMVKGLKTKKYLIAGCGVCEDLQAFLDWMSFSGNMEDKKKFSLDRKVEIDALVVNKKGMVIRYAENLYPYRIEAPFHAIGSGGDFAIGAMAFGASAIQAVRIASKYDVRTGGAIKELKW